MGCLVDLIYVLSAVALWQLSSTKYNILWWCILISAILMFGTARIFPITYRKHMRNAQPQDEFEVQIANKIVMRNGIINFWLKANMVVAVVTVLLSGIGLFLGLGN